MRKKTINSFLAEKIIQNREWWYWRGLELGENKSKAIFFLNFSSSYFIFEFGILNFCRQLCLAWDIFVLLFMYDKSHILKKAATCYKCHRHIFVENVNGCHSWHMSNYYLWSDTNVSVLIISAYVVSVETISATIYSCNSVTSQNLVIYEDTEEK